MCDRAAHRHLRLTSRCSEEDSDFQIDQSGAPWVITLKARLAAQIAAVCAFSVPFRMTQRDGRQGEDMPSSRTLLRPACLYRTG